jgi:hypothetical protein
MGHMDKAKNKAEELLHLLRGDAHLLRRGLATQFRSSLRWITPSLLITSARCTGIWMVRA